MSAAVAGRADVHRPDTERVDRTLGRRRPVVSRFVARGGDAAVGGGGGGKLPQSVAVATAAIAEGGVLGGGALFTGGELGVGDAPGVARGAGGGAGGCGDLPLSTIETFSDAADGVAAKGACQAVVGGSGSGSGSGDGVEAAAAVAAGASVGGGGVAHVTIRGDARGALVRPPDGVGTEGALATDVVGVVGEEGRAAVVAAVAGGVAGDLFGHEASGVVAVSAGGCSGVGVGPFAAGETAGTSVVAV